MRTRAELEIALQARLGPLHVERVEPVAGGISASTTAVDVRHVDGRRARLVLRELPRTKLQREHALLTHLTALATVPVPRSLGVVELADGATARISEWVDGEPGPFHPDPPRRVIDAYARALRALHTTTVGTSIVAASAPRPPGTPDPRDEPWRRHGAAVLASVWPPADAPPVLMHGDPWPGNLLWRDERLVAVIDWEDAALGDPLRDLAIARFELSWLLGHQVAERLTHTYARSDALDADRLAVWDLWAALRPSAQGVDEWAPGYVARGRPELTASAIRARQAVCVRRACAALGRPVPARPDDG